MCRARNWMMYLWCDNVITLVSLRFRSILIINRSTVAEESQLLFFQSRFYHHQICLASIYLLCLNCQSTALSCLTQFPCVRALSRIWLGAKRTPCVKLTSVCPSVTAPMDASTSGADLRIQWGTFLRQIRHTDPWQSPAYMKPVCPAYPVNCFKRFS
jgi:hypothetical protein